MEMFEVQVNVESGGITHRGVMAQAVKFDDGRCALSMGGNDVAVFSSFEDMQRTFEGAYKATFVRVHDRAFIGAHVLESMRQR